MKWRYLIVQSMILLHNNGHDHVLRHTKQLQSVFVFLTDAVLTVISFFSAAQREKENCPI